jgi:hypothetical protein
MRIDISLENEIKVFEKAKKLIQEKGTKNYVLELRQLSCMGGAGYVVTPQKNLDKTYVGYRGFLTYHQVCEELDRMKKQEQEGTSLGNFDLDEFFEKVIKREI